MTEITSPPYPSTKVTVLQLFHYLDQYRDWVLEQLQIFREISKDMAMSIPVPEETPQMGVWEAVSVLDHFLVLRQARYLREAWDSVVRDHEEDWDDELAVSRRYYIVQASSAMLADAFTNPETREAREETRMQEAEARMREVSNILGQTLLGHGFIVLNPDDDDDKGDDS